LLQPGRDGADHGQGNLILQIQNISQAAIETVSPQMRAGSGINELDS
jgi:hypothetical protein